MTVVGHQVWNFHMNLKKHFFFVPMVTLYINVRKKQKGQSRMDNPETLGIMGTQDTGRIHKTPDEYTRHQTNTQDTGRIDKTTQQVSCIRPVSCVFVRCLVYSSGVVFVKDTHRVTGLIITPSLEYSSAIKRLYTRSPLGQRKSVFLNSYESFYGKTRCYLNTSDCFIEVTRWAGLTV
jgi:hypothetical protein